MLKHLEKQHQEHQAGRDVVRLTDILVLGLATWRTSKMITEERGPFDMFERLRSLAGIEHDKHTPVAWQNSGFSLLLMCIYCNSVWIALGYTLLNKIFPFPIIAIAASAIPVLIHEVQEWLGHK